MQLVFIESSVAVVDLGGQKKKKLLGKKKKKNWEGEKIILAGEKYLGGRKKSKSLHYWAKEPFLQYPADIKTIIGFFISFSFLLFFFVSLF